MFLSNLPVHTSRINARGFIENVYFIKLPTPFARRTDLSMSKVLIPHYITNIQRSNTSTHVRWAARYTIKPLSRRTLYLGSADIVNY